MKKVQTILFILFILFTLLFATSCKNFLNGEDVLSELQKSIEYVNAAYAKIEFTCDIDACKFMNPANGTKIEDKYIVPTQKGIELCDFLEISSMITISLN